MGISQIWLLPMDVPRGTMREHFTWNNFAEPRKFKIRGSLFLLGRFDGGLDPSIAYQKEPLQ
jgi:hypothetical protein